MRKEALAVGASLVNDTTDLPVEFLELPQEVEVRPEYLGERDCQTVSQYSSSGNLVFANTRCHALLLGVEVNEHSLRFTCRKDDDHQCGGGAIKKSGGESTAIYCETKKSGDLGPESMTCRHGRGRGLDHQLYRRTVGFWDCPESVVDSIPSKGWQAPPDQVENTGEDRRKLGIELLYGTALGLPLDFGGGLFVAPIDHFTLELSAFYAYHDRNDTKANGYALAPALQYQFSAEPENTGFLSAGMQYLHLTRSSTAGNGLGFFMNIGYEWRFQYGVSFLAAVGGCWMQKIRLSDSQKEATVGGKVSLDWSFGLRFGFL